MGLSLTARVKGATPHLVLHLDRGLHQWFELTLMETSSWGPQELPVLTHDSQPDPSPGC